MKHTDILILGAGCAGTLLAHHLELAGYGGHVRLVDSRVAFTREQRWCTWRPVPISLSDLVSRSWNAWAVRDDDHLHLRRSEQYAYQHIYAPDFFAHLHRGWEHDTDTRLHRGERVLGVTPDCDGVTVMTTRNLWRAGTVFDARHRGSGRLDESVRGARGAMCQTFLGWTIEFDRAAFDTEAATLMDFRIRGAGEVAFAYVLPFSPMRALVESTSFSVASVPASEHTTALRNYIAEVYGDDYRVVNEEAGSLPMTTAPLPCRIAPNLYALGVAGGAARASSGYAFDRIYRHTEALARALVDGSPLAALDGQVVNRKYRLLDAIFLEALANGSPHFARDCFMRLFERVPPDALVRFLGEESTPVDDLHVIAALPKLNFATASIRRLLRHSLAPVTGRDDRPELIVRRETRVKEG